MRQVPIYPPIADYALLSDCHSCALVSTDGSIDWCTFHRFEARPVFGRILDWAKAGFFRIAPLDEDYEPSRRYLPGTNVLETTFRTPSGTLVLTDFFAYRVPEPGEGAHSAHPDHQLIRITREEVHAKLDATTSTWAAWAERCTYDGPYRDEVVRSALVLKALTNAPTGSIVAAATTSLPEEIGGERNWDYRFSWLRDSALTLNALFALGYDEEAQAYMDWLKRTTAGRASELQIMYGVGGERLLPEVELDWLEGYRGSRPVRIGNGAYSQFQLDVFGELLDTTWLYRSRGGEIDDVFWSFLRDVADVVARRWSAA